MFHFRIVTPESIVLESEAYSVTLPVEGGEVTIMTDHMPYIGSVSVGEILVRAAASEAPQSLATSGGFTEFHDNVLTLLADTAERAADIDLERAEAARSRAEELRRSTPETDPEAYARTQMLLEKELARIRVAKKHRTHQGPHIADR